MFAFSAATYSVQDIIFVNLPVVTEICMECVFANNAPSQGCLVLFSSFSSITFNVTIVRTTDASKAFSCTPVPTSLLRHTVQEFIVTVYDYDSDDSLNLSEPAIILPQPLQVESIIAIT